MVPGADVRNEVGERLAVAEQLVLSMPGPSQTVSLRAAMVGAGTPPTHGDGADPSSSNSYST